MAVKIYGSNQIDFDANNIIQNTQLNNTVLNDWRVYKPRHGFDWGFAMTLTLIPAKSTNSKKYFEYLVFTSILILGVHI